MLVKFYNIHLYYVLVTDLVIFCLSRSLSHLTHSATCRCHCQLKRREALMFFLYGAILLWNPCWWVSVALWLWDINQFSHMVQHPKCISFLFQYKLTVPKMGNVADLLAVLTKETNIPTDKVIHVLCVSCL